MKNKGSIQLRRLVLLGLFSLPFSLSAETIPMVCSWNLFLDDHQETDTFIFNIDKKTVYWVDEEEVIKLDRVNEGVIQFEGIPMSRVNIDKTKYKTHIPIKFILNRITGKLTIESEYAKPNYESRCVIKQPLL